MSNRNLILIGVLLLLLAAGLPLLRGFGASREYSSEQFLMDTLVSIKVYGSDREKLKLAVNEAYAEMRRIAELADGFAEPDTAAFGSSDVCRVNSHAGKQPVKVDGDTMAMLLLSKKYCQISEGAFDVTIGPVMELWGFGGKNPQVPPPERIKEALAKVGDQDLVLHEREGTVLLRREGMKIDLGAVAKGYATEKALQVLKKHGIEKGLIDAGGNIRVLGRNLHDSPWRIGIKDPRKANGVVAALPLEDASAVTSADYYRGFEANGKRYHHILDPRTGYPAGYSMTATAVTQDAGLADVLSTVFFVLTPEKAIQLAEQMPGVDLFLVTTEGRILHTSPLRDKVEVKPRTGYRYDQGR